MRVDAKLRKIQPQPETIGKLKSKRTWRSRGHAPPSEHFAEVVHDLRNILFPSLIAVSLLSKALTKDNSIESQKHLSYLRSNLDRIISLANTLVCPGQRITEREFSPEDAIREAVLTAEYFAKGIEVTTDLDSTPNIRGDQNDFINTIINLLKNALEATEKDGSVRVSLKNKGTGIEIVVSDTGCGIQGDIQIIFDTYYTTKGEQGNGLGLSRAKRLIEEMGGKIAVESTPGEGTAFTIDIPIVPQERNGANNPPAKAIGPNKSEHAAGTGQYIQNALLDARNIIHLLSTCRDFAEPQLQLSQLKNILDNIDCLAGYLVNSGRRNQPASRISGDIKPASKNKILRILLVEDEENIRNMQKDFLISHGYEVETAQNIEEALAFMKRQRFDLVITDLSLTPKKNDGIDLIEALNDSPNRIPVILVTGYDDATVVELQEENKIAAAFIKGKSLRQLLNIIKDL